MKCSHHSVLLWKPVASIKRGQLRVCAAVIRSAAVFFRRTTEAFDGGWTARTSLRSLEANCAHPTRLCATRPGWTKPRRRSSSYRNAAYAQRCADSATSNCCDERALLSRSQCPLASQFRAAVEVVVVRMRCVDWTSFGFLPPARTASATAVSVLWGVSGQRGLPRAG